MVKRIFTSILCLLWLAAIGLPAQAQNQQLTVEPDRTRLYEGEVLTLTVKGSMEIDINLSNLFDFDMSNLPSPNIEKVEPDFEILARNQQYSIRTVNSRMVGEITWTYQLAPKKTGELTIPALKFRESMSEPVTIEVVDGTPPNQAATGRDSFIELSADKAEVYVQEQLILTIRLFFRGNLIRGELSEPDHPHVIIESLGRQQESSQYRDGLRYRVVERRYALFPQRPGMLKLPPIRFEGQMRDSAGKLKFLRDSEELFEVPVKDVPAQFSGKTWLPATGLALEESGLPPSLEVTTGENLTREIRMTAAGLPSETLPPLPDQVPDGLRSYPEAPERNTETTPTGLTSSLSQSVALVPVQPGTMTLPAIRIPWWDTEADRERVAVIPARTLMVTDAGTAPNTNVPADAATTSANPDTPEKENASSAQNASATDNPWLWTSLGLALLWLITALAWWYSRKHYRQRDTSPGGAVHDTNERAVFERLIRAARDGSPAAPELLVAWANLKAPGRGFHSATEVAQYFGHNTLLSEIRNLQARLFAPDQSGQEPAPWDGRPLAKSLQEIRQSQATDEAPDLPPLYPRGLG
ncbi:Oxygen tolerance [Marinobacter gudaonensis]|uniref:Oxygen tolerance n=1 Tax=Marinobacter gudaonensis TaxID=375760 RepID=A0A1I6GHJ9_9GAMM|nr:BatD family protein [Marinobacter gudaonensis]SFR41611.1 Oxygen tolerance [Marinobacter gudaonensis]